MIESIRMSRLDKFIDNNKFAIDVNTEEIVFAPKGNNFPIDRYCFIDTHKDKKLDVYVKRYLDSNDKKTVINFAYTYRESLEKIGYFNHIAILKEYFKCHGLEYSSRYLLISITYPRKIFKQIIKESGLMNNKEE